MSFCFGLLLLLRKEKLYLNIIGEDDYVEIIVRDIRGLKLRHTRQSLVSNRELPLNTEEFSNGIYFIEVRSSNINKTLKVQKK